ncbi:MAG: ATPase, partial [Deltaproteobacteria bacterium]|nr:ATPase [Deltaproteobacteria bacterium]
MEKRLGDRLLEDRVLTEKQLEMALERQRLRGGRIGDNLVALGLLSEQELSTFFKRTPKAPRTVEETGLSLSFICDLVMKHVLLMGEFTLPEVAEKTKLPISVLDKAVDELRREHMLET